MSEFGAEWARIVLAAVGAVFSGLFIGGILGFGSMVALRALPSVWQQMDGIEIILLPLMGALGGGACAPLGLIGFLLAQGRAGSTWGIGKSSLVGAVTALASLAVLALILSAGSSADEGARLWTSTKVLITLEIGVAAVTGALGACLARRAIGPSANLTEP